MNQYIHTNDWHDVKTSKQILTGLQIVMPVFLYSVSFFWQYESNPVKDLELLLMLAEINMSRQVG